MKYRFVKETKLTGDVCWFTESQNGTDDMWSYVVDSLRYDRGEAYQLYQRAKEGKSLRIEILEETP